MFDNVFAVEYAVRNLVQQRIELLTNFGGSKDQLLGN
jgi:hypothetical protein